MGLPLDHLSADCPQTLPSWFGPRRTLLAGRPGCERRLQPGCMARSIVVIEAVVRARWTASRCASPSQHGLVPANPGRCCRGAPRRRVLVASLPSGRNVAWLRLHELCPAPLAAGLVDAAVMGRA